MVEMLKGRLVSSRTLHPAGVFLAAWLWIVAPLSVVLVFTRRNERGALAEASVFLAGLAIACLFAARVSVERKDAPAFTRREVQAVPAQTAEAVHRNGQLTRNIEAARQ